MIYSDSAEWSVDHEKAAKYRDDDLRAIAREIADAAWGAGLAELIQSDRMEYHHFTLTSHDWVFVEDSIGSISADEMRDIRRYVHDRIAELHAENGDCK